MTICEQIEATNGHAYRVAFKCRYRNVNTYWVESRTCVGVDVEVTDEGWFYRPPALAEDIALALVREYETRAWLNYVRWCNENGYEPDTAHRHVLAA